MSDHVNPRERDPRFPNRPTHPDFIRLSEAVQAIDAQADAGVAMPEIVDVDMDSLLYLINNRIGIWEQERGETFSHGQRQMLMSMYVDAFTLGKRYAETRPQGVDVTTTPSAGADGAVVVFIDTEFEPDASDGGPGLRVLLNDDDIYVGKPYEPQRGGD